MRAFETVGVDIFGVDSFSLEGKYGHVFFSITKIDDVPILFQLNDGKDWYVTVTNIKQRLRVQYAFDDDFGFGFKVLGKVIDEILDGIIKHNDKAEIMWGN